MATRTGKVGLWDWDIEKDRVSWTESLYAIHGVTPATFDGSAVGCLGVDGVQLQFCSPKHREGSVGGLSPRQVDEAFTVTTVHVRSAEPTIADRHVKLEDRPLRVTTHETDDLLSPLHPDMNRRVHA
jgi:hypothetical protein